MSIRDLIRWDRPTDISIRQGAIGQSLASLQEDMNRLFDHFYSEAQVRLTDWSKNTPAAPSLNMTETAAGYKVRMEIAGMNPDDLDVEITAATLTVKGEKRDEKKEEDENYLHQEISYGSFYRSIALPESANYKKAEASFKNGVLTVDIPKKAEAMLKPEKLQIKKVA